MRPEPPQDDRLPSYGLAEPPVPRVDETVVQQEPFFGRVHEQRQFRALLDDLLNTPKDEGDQPGYSHVVLVHGIGGIGKSRLCARLRDIASEDRYRGRVGVLSLDWEGSAIPTGERKMLLERLVEAFRETYSQRLFKTYHQLRGRIGQAEERIARQLRAEQDEFSPLVRLGLSAVKIAASSVGLSGAVGATAEEMLLAKKWLETRPRPEDRTLLVEGDGLLLAELGSSVRRAAQEQPLVVFLDSYELVAWADRGWLQEIYRLTGRRVAWVLAGRWTDPQRLDYVDRWPTVQLQRFNVDRLNVHEISAFLQRGAPHRTLIEADRDAVRRVTGGVPLAVYLAANMWSHGASIGAIVSGDDNPGASDEDIVTTMVRRYLKYARDDPTRPHDYRQLEALALLPDNAPARTTLRAEILARLWDVDEVTAVLDQLSGRYEFVMARPMKLHDAVRDTLRRSLLSPAHRHDLRSMNRRAVDFLALRLAELQEHLPTLRERCEDDEWQNVVAALAWHRYWEHEEAGWETVVAALPGTLGYRLPLARILLDLAAHFTDSAGHAIRVQLRTLQNGLGEPAYRGDFVLEDDALRVLRAPRRAVRLSVQPDEDCPDERMAILDWQLGRAQMRAGTVTSAFESLRAAATRAPSSCVTLRRSIGSDLQRLALSTLLVDGEPRRSEIGQQAARLATDLDPTDAAGWDAMSIAYRAFEQHEDALNAIDKAVRIERDRAVYHSNRGSCLLRLGRYESALTAFTQALTLEEGDPRAQVGRAIALYLHGDWQAALSTSRVAVNLDPKDSRARSTHGYIMLMMGRAAEALAEFDEAVRLEPGYVTGHTNRGMALLAGGRLAEAEEAFMVAAQRRPGQARSAWAFAGALAWIRDDIPQARQRCQESLRSGTILTTVTTPFRDAVVEAVALSCLGRGTEAAKVLNRAVPRDTLGEPGPLLTLFELLASSNRPPDRIAELLTVIRNLPHELPDATDAGGHS